MRRLLVILIVTLFSTLLFTLSEAKAWTPADSLKIYIIHSYPRGLWSEDSERGIIAALSQHKVQDYRLRTFIYDYRRRRKFVKEELANIKAELSKFQPDVILMFDDEAAGDLMSEINPLNYPIVVTGINKEESELAWHNAIPKKERNYSIVLERYPFEQPLKLLKKIKPSVTQITLLSSAGESSKLVSSQMVKEFNRHGGSFSGIKLKEVFADSNWSHWQEQVKKPRDDSEAFWVVAPWDVFDSNGKVVSLTTISQYYQENCRVPDLGVVNPEHVLGPLAAFSVNAEDLGFDAMNLALRAFKKGERIADQPIQNVRTVRLVMNKKRADNLGIQIPLSIMEFSKIERTIPMEYVN